jgi:hypothetical protein
MISPPIDTLESEIAALRRLIRQVLSMASQPENLDEALRTLRALSEAYSRLANLLKTQKDLQVKTVDLEADLKDALEQVGRQLGLSDGLADPNKRKDDESKNNDSK